VLPPIHLPTLNLYMLIVTILTAFVAFKGVRQVHYTGRSKKVDESPLVHSKKCLVCRASVIQKMDILF
jgi:hypothetical protein